MSKTYWDIMRESVLFAKTPNKETLAWNEGFAEGVAEERNRIQALLLDQKAKHGNVAGIDDLLDMISKGKFDV